jgi:hypothetical protein
VIVELVTRVVAVVRVVSVVTPVKNVLMKNKLKTLDFIGGFFMEWRIFRRAAWWKHYWYSFGKHVTPKPSK